MLLADCTHRPPCPGCPRLGERGPAAGPLARLEDFAREQGVELDPPEPSAPRGFRTRARLAVRGRSRSPKIGLFQRDSHRIADIPRCPIHHPRINEVAAAVRQGIRACGVAPYAERPHTGTLRYLQVSIDAAERAQLVLVGREPTPEPLAGLADRLLQELGPALHSLWWNGQPERDNAVLGPHWHRFAGPEAIEERHAGVRTFHPPGAFRQSHGELARQLVRIAGEWLPAPGRTVEYFAGCGGIGLPLAGRCPAIALNERGPESLRGLALGIEALPPEVRALTRLLPGPAEAHCDALRDAESVILDPPRRGAGPALVEAIRESGARRVLYASCEPGSFLAEAARLLEGSSFRLARIRPFDFFPYGLHLETLALFERA